MGLVKEFGDFIKNGNVLDLAVGVIIGGAFGKIVTSIVNDLIMPIIGKIMGGASFIDMFIPLNGQVATSLEEAKKAGAVFAYGSFIQEVINFIIIAFCIFMVVKAYNKMKKADEGAVVAGPSSTDLLLTEIRDTLKKNSN